METSKKALIDAINNHQAPHLTVEVAKQLKGRRIASMYFGYNGQDGYNDFVIGDVVSEYDYYQNLKEEHFQESSSKYKNRTEYWESYMSNEQILIRKHTMILLDENYSNRLHYYAYNCGFFEEPTFTCSDADRVVFFILID